ncbi:MAG: acetyl-CoA hydrolase/transferase family protein [Planctomycetota bacterium JB042]
MSRSRAGRGGATFRRIVPAEEAVESIRSGERVFVQGAAATPERLLRALVARASELEDVRVVHLHVDGRAPHLEPEVASSFRHEALFVGPNARRAIAEGRAEYIPVFLSDMPSLLTRGSLPLDAAFVHVSPPDAHGFCSLGTSVDCTLAATSAAKLVIAQVNPNVPRTHGDGILHVSDIDLAVEVDDPLFESPPPEIDDVARRIGEHVAEFVPDGATLQMGIGAIPCAVARALEGKRDLGIHTEMFTDVVVDLVERGVVTGARKEINRGKIVSTFVSGTKRLFEFVDDNPMIEMRPADYTNDISVIRRFRRMVAVNSAIEVDLTGQVCADSVGTRIVSGVGGQMDFIRGAAVAEDGRAIIALRSTAMGGTSSRLVPTLKPGAGVVTTRAHVELVATEYGVADLHGKSIPARARALIAIAHPAFRDRLGAAMAALHEL